MTGRVIGTKGDITARRDECAEVISRLAEQPMVDAKAISQLRRSLGSELAALVVSVAALQPKARKKFGPGVWWVTEKSLQQATPWQVAKLKSSWLGNRATYDLCCGVGGDSVQLAKHGSVVAVDLDAMLVEMAAANLVQSGVDPARVQTICSDVNIIKIPSEIAVHIDPDRRAAEHPGKGSRHSHPDHCRPAWPDVRRIITHSDSALVKLAPAANIELADLPESHRCWISLGGTVREQTLLCGSAVKSARRQCGGRSAVALASDGSATWFVPSTNNLESSRADVCNRPLDVLIDPDAAIRAAGLTETFACQHGLTILGSPSGYLTCDGATPFHEASLSMAVVGEVIWWGSCDDRKLRKELRSRGIYPSVIKVRGTDHNPAVLAKRYRKCGDQPVTLWIGRTGDGAYAAITQQLDE